MAETHVVTALVRKRAELAVAGFLMNRKNLAICYPGLTIGIVIALIATYFSRGPVGS